jgi:hypothetical protein
MKPIIVLSNVEHQCATFVWPDDLRYFVGYRFVEHSPKITAIPLSHPSTLSTRLPTVHDSQYSRSKAWLDNWQTAYAETENPLQLSFKTFSDGSARASVVQSEEKQEQTWHFVPEENGIRLWMRLRTDAALLGGFIMQQCLRFSSGIGSGFHRTVARVPFLSELLMQALGNANGTMTWVRNKDDWQALPVPFTRYHTAAGKNIYEDSAGQIDCGLIVRESASRTHAPTSYWLTAAPEASWETWAAGLYWERTAYVSNRHPADCLHAGLDFGPLAAGESRTVQGKFYWLEGTKDDLYALWQKEFGENRGNHIYQCLQQSG